MSALQVEEWYQAIKNPNQTDQEKDTHMINIIYAIKDLCEQHPHDALTLFVRIFSDRSVAWPFAIFLRYLFDSTSWSFAEPADGPGWNSYLVVIGVFFELIEPPEIQAKTFDFATISAIRDMGFLFSKFGKPLPVVGDRGMDALLRSVPLDHEPRNPKTGLLYRGLSWQFKELTGVSHLPGHLQAYVKVVNKSAALHFGLPRSR